MRRLVTAFTLASLCYLQVWKGLLAFRQADAFLLKEAPTPQQYLAAIAGTSLLAAVIYGFELLSARTADWLRTVFVYCCALLLANGLRGALGDYFPVLRSGLFKFVRPSVVFLLVGLAAVAGFLILKRFRGVVERAGSFALLIFSPLVILILTTSAFDIARYDPALMADKPLAAKLTPRRPGKLLWVIFDEWDYHMSFGNRPDSVHLPEIDRLRREALFGENTFPPSDTTRLSLPSLIHGRLVRTSTPTSETKMLLTFRDGGQAIFGQEPTFFSKARLLGVNTALFGWYLPYCRTLNSSLTGCWWMDMQRELNSTGDTFGEAFSGQPRTLLETPLFSVFGQSLATRNHAHMYLELLARAKAWASDPSPGMCFVHFNTPHAPYFYDARSERMNRGNLLNGYYDALALVDRTVGELRDSLERAGVWDSTTLLISSDHWFRFSPMVNGRRDQHIPFLLHMAGQKDAIAYSHKFNSVVTGDLILAILGSKVNTPADAAAWLDGAGDREVASGAGQ